LFVTGLEGRDILAILLGMQTALHLLTRDGAIYVAFSPHLTAAQYAELMRVVEAPLTPSKLELCAALEDAAARWGNELKIQDGVNGHVRADP
jgi:hypothetical protein